MFVGDLFRQVRVMSCRQADNNCVRLSPAHYVAKTYRVLKLPLRWPAPLAAVPFLVLMVPLLLLFSCDS